MALIYTCVFCFTESTNICFNEMSTLQISDLTLDVFCFSPAARETNQTAGFCSSWCNANVEGPNQLGEYRKNSFSELNRHYNYYMIVVSTVKPVRFVW